MFCAIFNFQTRSSSSFLIKMLNLTDNAEIFAFQYTHSGITSALPTHFSIDEINILPAYRLLGYNLYKILILFQFIFYPFLCHFKIICSCIQ